MNKDLEIIKVQIKENIATLITQKRLEEAKMLIKQYQKMVTGDFEVFSMLAIIAMEEGNFTEAEDLLYDGLFINNNSFDLWYNLAYLFEIQEKYPKARAIYSNLLKKECDHTQHLLLQESLSRCDNIAIINDDAEVLLQNKKILQGTMEIANQSYTLTDAMRKKGYSVRSMNYYASYLGYQGDLSLSFEDCKSDEEIHKKINKFAKQAIKEYDLFHFHFGTSLTLDHSDLPLLKTMNKVMVMHFWGSDVRRFSIAQKHNPYVKVKNYDEEQIIESLRYIAKYMEHCIVPDMELYLYVKEFFKNVHILPTAIDLSKYKKNVITKVNSKPLLVHAPTSPEIKGTKYIIAAIEELKKKYDFDFTLVQGMKHEDAQKIYQEADIIIDQLLLGYGVVAIEGMAMGKTVVCWISDYLKEHYPKDLPIIVANPDTIKTVLEDLLNNLDRLPAISKQGPVYVEKYHSAEKVADSLLEIYKKILY